MVSKLLKGGLATAVALSLSYSFADAKQLGAELWGTAGDADATFMSMTKKLGDIGFIISDPHARINDSYKHKYGSTTLDNLGFFSIAHNDKMRKLLEEYPEFGGFTPFNLHIYKKTGKDTTWVGHLRPEVMADIVGVHDPKARAEFSSMFPTLDNLILSEMGSTKVKNLYFDSLPEKPMMKFSFKIDLSEHDDDLETFIEDFQEVFEETFEDAGYLIAGYKNIGEYYEYAGQEFKYPAYFIYSLCHFPFSNAIFNKTPEAGIFAPCSLYMYVNEEEDTLYIGMPKLANWAKVANITDEEDLQLINDLDEEIIKIFTEELEASEIE
jgi:uncharacterized protein (DUF302 family)